MSETHREKLMNIQIVNDRKLIGYVSHGRRCQVLWGGKRIAASERITRREPGDVADLNRAIENNDPEITALMKETLLIKKNTFFPNLKTIYPIHFKKKRTDIQCKNKSLIIM